MNKLLELLTGKRKISYLIGYAKVEPSTGKKATSEEGIDAFWQLLSGDITPHSAITMFERNSHNKSGESK